MGITNGTMEFLNEYIFVGRMVELGDQVLYCGAGGLAKEYFTAMGMIHTNIDINGNADLQLDFCKDIPKNDFDILTDFGFAEHIADQYQCFKNIHNLVRDKGLMIHELPGQPLFPFHEMCFYYTPDFIDGLARLNNYKIIHNALRFDEHNDGGVVLNAVLRRGDNEFISREQFETLKIYKNKVKCERS